MKDKKSIVIIEGPDGAGKSTLVNYLIDTYGYKMYHSSSETANDMGYHLDLLDKPEDKIVLDRCNLGEIVYPIVYGREPKMTNEEQEEFMRECERRDAIYIIFYASDFNTLKERLFKRGDTQQVLDNAEKINEVFKDLAEQLEYTFSNVYTLDISKVNDQIAFFQKILLQK